MNIKEVKARLDTLGIPIAYRSFKSAVKTPYIAYFVDQSDVRGSDSRNLVEEVSYIVELYTSSKNTQLENQIKQLFSDFELDINESIIKSSNDSEEILLNSFSFNTILKIKGEQHI